MSKAALEALSRAGVDTTTVQRAGSDTMRFLPDGWLQARRLLAAPHLLEALGREEGGRGPRSDEFGNRAQPDHRRADGSAGRGRCATQHERLLGQKERTGWSSWGQTSSRLAISTSSMPLAFTPPGAPGFTHSADAFSPGCACAGSAAQSGRLSGAGNRLQAREGSFGIFGPTPSGVASLNSLSSAMARLTTTRSPTSTSTCHVTTQTPWPP